MLKVFGIQLLQNLVKKGAAAETKAADGAEKAAEGAEKAAPEA